MSERTPYYKVKRVYEDGTESAPEIIPVTEMPWNINMGRREFFGVGMTTAAVLGVLAQSAPSLADRGQQRDMKEVFAHTGLVQFLAMSSDGSTLLSAGSDRLCKVWKLPEGALAQSLVNPAAQQDTILALNAEELSETRVTRTSSSAVGSRLSVVHQELKDSSASRNASRHVLAAIEHPDTISHLATMPKGQLLIIGRDGGEIEIRRADDGALVKTLSEHKDAITALAVTASGSELISASKDDSVKVWSLPEGALLHSIPCSSAGSVAYSSEMKMAAVGDAAHGAEIRLFRLPDGKMVKKFRAQKAGVTALALTADGQILATGSSDGSIWLWEMAKGKRLARLMDLKASQSAAHGITYTATNETGQVITYTLPCGSPIPSGAVCTCNCVPGSFVVRDTSPSPPARSYTPSYSPPTCSCVSVQICTCDSVCVCLPVCICLAV